MTIQELAAQAVGHVKQSNGRLTPGDVADAYCASLEKQGANHGQLEMFYCCMNEKLKASGLPKIF